MTALSTTERILILKAEYPDAQHYYQEGLSLNCEGSFKVVGFLGAPSVIFLHSKGDIHCEAPSCIAAPLVTMVARSAINLGIQGRSSHAQPARLCAAKQLCITAPHVTIGDFSFVEFPKAAAISCKKLTLIVSKEESKSENRDQPTEIVKSWVVLDSTEVEIVKK